MLAEILTLIDVPAWIQALTSIANVIVGGMNLGLIVFTLREMRKQNEIQISPLPTFELEARNQAEFAELKSFLDDQSQIVETIDAWKGHLAEVAITPDVDSRTLVLVICNEGKVTLRTVTCDLKLELTHGEQTQSQYTNPVKPLNVACSSRVAVPPGETKYYRLFELEGLIKYEAVLTNIKFSGTDRRIHQYTEDVSHRGQAKALPPGRQIIEDTASTDETEEGD